MIDISVTQLNKFFGESQILKDLSFDIQEGEHVGLLGKNGAGKTTLFKILCHELEYEGGSVVIPKFKNVGIVAQIPSYPPEFCAEDVLKTAFAATDALKTQMDALSHTLQTGNEDAKLLEDYGRLCEKFEALGGYDVAFRLNKVCNGIGIPPEMRTRLFSQLSGGEKTRVNLGRMILQNTDILLLDEPTNHLDMQAVRYLEEFLSHYKGTVVAISHDRYFLDNAISRIIEIEDGQAQFYNGNYSSYVLEKQARFDEKLKLYTQQEKKLAHIQHAADQMRVWAQSNTNLYKRVHAIEGRIARMEQMERPKTAKKLSASFQAKEGQSTDILTLRNLSKAYDGVTLLDNISLIAKDSDRIAVIGDNGCGKTTFLNLILQKVPPDSGTFSFGLSTKIAYLPQIIRFPNEHETALDVVTSALKLTLQQGRNRLGQFQFTEDDVFREVGLLSGGERSRLMLCIIMYHEINLLILDEPTNHLDIASREWMEAALADYEGNLLFVSHDRYFINQFANRIWDLKDGRITDYRGTFAHYMQATAKPTAEERPAPPKEQEKEKALRSKGQRKSPYTLEKQLLAAEREIARQEEALGEQDGEIEKNASDFQLLSRLLKEREEAKARLDTLYETWEALSAQAEENPPT